FRRRSDYPNRPWRARQVERERSGQCKTIFHAQNGRRICRTLPPAGSDHMKRLLMLLSIFLPAAARRSFLESQFGYKIHSPCRLGLCWLAPTRLVMEEGSEIGHLTVCKSIDLLHLKPYASIGRGNWITGFPLGPSPHFAR